MNLSRMAEVFALLLVLVFLAPLTRASVLCDDGGSCSVECHPVEWERNLCRFYLEIAAWRSEARRCGLSVGAPPPRDQPLSGEEQWAQAQSYWHTVLQEWRMQAQSVNIIQEEVSSGSGISRSGETILEPASPLPPLQQSQASWLQLLNWWLQDYTTWTTHATASQQQTNGNAFPTSDSSRIVAALMPGESSSSVLSNSGGWGSLLADWQQANAAYNTTYSALCYS